MAQANQQTPAESKEKAELKKLADKLLNESKPGITELIYRSHRRIQDYFNRKENANTDATTLLRHLF